MENEQTSVDNIQQTKEEYQTSVDNIQQIKEEYIRLRNEIVINSKNIFQLLGIMITSVFTIQSLLLVFDDSFDFTEIIYLLPILLITAIVLVINVQLESTSRIASYLRCELEPKIPGYNWETNLHSCRRNIDKEKRFNFFNTVLYVPICLVFICFSIYIMIIDRFNILQTIFAILILIMFLVSIFSIYKAGKKIYKKQKDNSSDYYKNIWDSVHKD